MQLKKNKVNIAYMQSKCQNCFKNVFEYIVTNYEGKRWVSVFIRIKNDYLSSIEQNRVIINYINCKFQINFA